jgi:hypothetical protein
LNRGPLAWHYLRTKFHENVTSGSEVINGGHADRQTDRQTGDVISLLSILESGLKMTPDHIIATITLNAIVAFVIPLKSELSPRFL